MNIPTQLNSECSKKKKNKNQVGIPKTMVELEDSGWPELARVYGFVYKGGAGMRMEHYKYLDGPKPKERSETPDMPTWWPGRGRFGGYVKNIQGGWAGPIVSFWTRKSENNGYFS